MAFVDNTTGGRVIEQGFLPCKVTLSGTVAAGDLIGYSSGWVAADMDSSPKVYPELIAGGAGVSGDEITAFRKALIDLTSGCTATAGDEIFANTTAGGYTTSTVGIAHCVGYVVSAQRIMVEPFTLFPTIRISRDYDDTSGEHVSMQLKPNLTAATAGITALELSPRAASGIAASKVVALFAGIDLKGAAGGNVTTVRCVEAKLESASGSTRTVSAAYCLDCMNSMHGTVTALYPIRVGTAGGNAAWTGFALLPDDSAVANDEDTGTANTIAGYIKVTIGSATRYIYTYSVVPSG